MLAPTRRSDAIYEEDGGKIVAASDDCTVSPVHAAS